MNILAINKISGKLKMKCSKMPNAPYSKRYVQFKRAMIMKIKFVLFTLLMVIGIVCAKSQNQETTTIPINLSGDLIEDYLLEKLNEHRILIIPECLSHDSYDAIQLPIRLIKRWQKTNSPKKLFIGLEHENLDGIFRLVRNNEYHKVDRFATICPGAWGLFSTRSLNEYLFYADLLNTNPDKLEIFGFENSYHYYSDSLEKYVLPSQLDTLNGAIEKIPNLKSNAPMIIKYTYSRFFRDNLSFKSVERKIKNNPDAYFIIIVGNAHTLKKWSLNETDYQIIDAYSIDTTKYAHTLGYYLKKNYNPLFIQSKIDTLITKPTLTTGSDSKIDTESYTHYFYNYFYLIPNSKDVNLEEPPLLSIPSVSNLNLLKNKNFQYYNNDEFELVAQNLIYLFTGITPEIEEDTPGIVGSCTFINPETESPIDFDLYVDSLMIWYNDGTFLKRISENLRQYNHRNLFKGIFRLMKKENFETFTKSEQNEFMSYLYAALSVIGNKNERDFARRELEDKFGSSEEYYFYFKRLYGIKY